VRSVNGPWDTVIRGRGPRGPDAVRGVYMTQGALIGFTVENGHTRLDGNGSFDRDGGGINMYPSTSAVVSNCIIRDNRAHDSGGTTWGTLYNCIVMGNQAERASGGSSSARLFNCLLMGNSAGCFGGGADQAKLYNCTVTDNEAASGGGVYNSEVCNGIVFGNRPDNAAASALRHTCSAPAAAGEGNLATDPKFVHGWRLAADSPCAGAGNPAYAAGTDIDGDAWGHSPAMGCDQPAPGAKYGELLVGILPDSATALRNEMRIFEAEVWGDATSNRWDFGDGSTAIRMSRVAHAWSESGEFEVVLTVYNDTYPEGVSATALIWVVDPPNAPATAWTIRREEGDPGYEAPFPSHSQAEAVVDVQIPIAH
jgi:hypothetical protein